MLITLLAVRWLLVLVFWSSGIAKVGRREETAFAAANFGVPEVIAPMVAEVLPLVEVMISLTLALGVALPVTGLTAASLLLVFSSGIGISLMRGKRFACGCGFGDQEISGVLIARNLVLAGLALTVAFVPPAGLAIWPLVARGTEHVANVDLVPIPAAVAVLGFTVRCLQVARRSLLK